MTTGQPTTATETTASMPWPYRLVAKLGGLCAAIAKPLVESHHKALQIIGAPFLVAGIVFTGASGGRVELDVLRDVTPREKR